MTEPTSAVEQAVQQQIAAARVRIQAAKERRTSLAEARRYGLARRHARKLAYLAEAEQRQADEQHDQAADHRASVRTTDGSATPTDGAASTTTEENLMDPERIAEDLITRTEQAVEQVARLAVDTGVTFKVTDVVDAVERALPAGYPMPEDGGVTERRNTIESMAQDILSGAMYEDQA